MKNVVMLLVERPTESCHIVQKLPIKHSLKECNFPPPDSALKILKESHGREIMEIFQSELSVAYRLYTKALVAFDIQLRVLGLSPLFNVQSPCSL